MPRHSRGSPPDTDTDDDSLQMPGCSRCTAPLTEEELALFKPNRGRCTECQALWSEKLVCPVCEIQWDDSDLDMVGCDGCDFWVHASCDKRARRAAEAGDEDFTFFCPQCRHQQARKEQKEAQRASGSGGPAGRVAQPFSADQPEKRPVGRPPKLGRPPGVGVGRPPLAKRPVGRPPKNPGRGRGRQAEAPPVSPGRGRDKQFEAAPEAAGRDQGRQSEPAPVPAGRGRGRGRGPLPPGSSGPRMILPGSGAIPARRIGRPPKDSKPDPNPTPPGAPTHPAQPRPQANRAARARSAFQIFASQYRRQMHREGKRLPPEDLHQAAKEAYRGLPTAQRQAFEAQSERENRSAALAATAAERNEQAEEPSVQPRRPGRPPLSGPKRIGRPPKTQSSGWLHGISGLSDSSGQGIKRPLSSSMDFWGAPPPKKKYMVAPPVLAPKPMKQEPSERQPGAPLKQEKKEASANATAVLSGGVPETVPVACNGVRATFYVGSLTTVCVSDCCKGKTDAEKTFTPTHFEAHAGAGAAKKWKATLRIVPGGAADVPLDALPLAIGKWLEQHNLEAKVGRSKNTASSTAPRVAPVETARLLLPPPPPPVVWEPWKDVEKGNYTPVNATWAGDRCGACNSEVDHESDQLVSCDMCGATVHQSCYGIRELPAVDDMWLCRACEEREPDKEPQCVVCPVQGGPLKPTKMPGGWCHVSCMMWNPMLRAGNEVTMEPVEGIEEIEKTRWELKCVICKQFMGAKVQCSVGKCYNAFHPTCGRMAGLHMEMVESATDPSSVEYITFCPRHCTPRPETAGVRLATNAATGPKPFSSRGGAVDDVAEDLLAARLWNRQPYPPLPSLPVPSCAAGCARAMSATDDWKRQNHGTGAGHTTIKGFWMPELSAMVPVLPKSSKSVLANASKANRAALPATDLPPPEVDLEKLPENIPETLPVICNGKLAVFLTRTQSVDYQDTIMPASKFEQLCGKGDAKKWKTSIWIAGGGGEPKESMHDWLSERKLDRKALQAMNQNNQAHETYMAYIEAQSKPKEEQPAKEEGKEAKDSAKVSKEEPQEPEQPEAIDAEPPGAALVEAVVKSEEIFLSEHNVPAENGVIGADGDAEGDVEMTEAQAADKTPSKSSKAQMAAAAVALVKAEPKADVEMRGAFDADGPSAAIAEVEVPISHQMKPKSPPDGGVAEVNTAVLYNLAVYTGTVQAHLQGPPDLIAEPSEAIGLWLRIYWPDDDEWYVGKVHGYSAAEGKHHVYYPIDDGVEWIDLAVEVVGDRVQWLPGEDASKWPSALPPPPGQSRVSQKTEEEAASISGSLLTEIISEPQPSGSISGVVKEEDGVAKVEGPSLAEDPEAAIGWRLGIWWPDDHCFYYAVVENWDAQEGKHAVLYDDNEREALDLQATTVKWLTADGALVAQQAREAEATAAKAPGSHPAIVNIICNGMRGVFNVAETTVMTETGSTMTATEFERLAGKSASKKWKASIRLEREGGRLGQTIGDWLADHGVAGAKPSAPRPSAGGGLAALRRRQMQTQRSGAGGASKGRGGYGYTHHKDGCMCVLCKQTRRKLEGQGAAPTADRWQARSGKAAYISAVPMVVSSGSLRHSLHEIPFSRCWTPQEWRAAYREGHGSVCGGHRDARANAMQILPEAQDAEMEEVKQEDDRKMTGEVCEVAQPSTSTGDGAAGPSDSNGPQVASVISKAARGDFGAMTQVEKLLYCQKTERERITFGKSGVHGWGLFARRPLKAGSMVIEYRGDVVRPSMANRREQAYHQEGTDCYLFTVTDDHVVDATFNGTIGRFTNHSCSPSMYTRIVEVERHPHLVFYTKADILAGQELTYDYRFKEESGDSKLKCHCGAPNCRGTMN